MNKLLILNYHAILSDKEEAISDSFTLKFSQFREQINWIEKSQIPVVNLTTWQKNRGASNTLSIALTFDDGFASDFELVLPELMKRNIPATFFPIVSKIGQNGFLNWSQLQEMHEKDFEIGSHGLSHKRLTSFSTVNLKEEIVHSKQIIEQKLNHPVTLFSIPFGIYSQKLLRSLADHYTLVLTTRSILNTNDSSFLMHRFNCKNTHSFQEFQALILGNPQALRKRKIRSSLALRWNKINGFLDLFTKKNQVI
ncbi:MAG: polysaccharide deacetylase family protein [Crocinitomicaceae bacterium]